MNKEEQFETKSKEILDDISEAKKQTELLEMLVVIAESNEERLTQVAEKLTKVAKDTASLPIIDKRQRKESRITGVMMIAIALFSAYVSVAVGLVPQEMAREKLNGLFDIAFWWMSKGD